MNKLCSAFLVLALLHGACRAQGAAAGAFAPARPASFEATLQRALLHNAALRESVAGVGIAEQEARRARAPFLPRLDLSSSGQRIESFGTIPGLESLMLGGRNRAHYISSGLTLGMNVLNGGADLAALQLAHEKQNGAGLQVRLQRVAVARAVLDGFHALRQAEFDMKMASLQTQSKAATLKQAESEAALGRRAALALSEARYEAEQGELDYLMRQRAYRAARRELAWMMGEGEAEDGGSDYRLVETGTGAPAAYRAVLVRHGFDETARTTEADLSASRVAQARLDVARARSRYLPTLDIVATNTFAGLSQSGTGSAFQNQHRDKLIFGFKLNWNLFNGFDTDADVKAASLRVVAAEAARDGAIEAQRKQVAALARPLADALEQADIQRRKLSLAERKLDISRVKLELGKADAGTHRHSELEVELQRLEVGKRAETVEYYQGMLLLQTPDWKDKP